ncbi:sensor histidine kinase [uncultured Parasutterella sp.]|uniref:sensor histidine kinase n=1 Tax=uncultured Parasutterella sp. TaxID=1263098 RepID=UPI0025CC0729|nr:sensor histidine kinase [uncultured Parasutterella sp.]
MLTAFIVLAAPCVYAAKDSPTVFRVSVMQSDEHLFHESIIENLEGALEKALGAKTKVEISTDSPETIKTKLREGRVELVFCNSVLYRALLPYGVRDLATVHSDWNPNPNRADGAALIVKRDSEISSLNQLLNLKDPKVAMEKSRHFDVLYYILGEFETLKLDIEKFKTFLSENTQKSSELVKDVIQGKADAALLPACFLEQHVVEYPSLYREIKVLNPLRSSELPCTVSTTLYPNWSVLITPNISMKQATDIAATLLTQSKSSDGAWWSVSTQFDGVDKLLKNLKVEQYSYLREWTLRRFFEEYFPFIILFGAFLTGVILYSCVANRLIKIRTRQLSQSLLRLSKYKKEFELVRRDNEIYHRMGIVSHISSLISHELRQPLNTISCYSQGLLMRLEKGPMEQGQISDIVYQIHKKTQGADEIIKKVRDFAKFGSRPVATGLNQSVRKAVDVFLLSSQCASVVEFKPSEAAWIKIDPFELELLVLNLLRNASEALIKTANAQIDVNVTINKETSELTLSVKDNGPKLSEETLIKIKRGFDTTKKNGTGMGLVIVSEIVSNARGKLDFIPSKDRGLLVKITFPLDTHEQKN